jgi:hypothetical protein
MALIKLLLRNTFYVKSHFIVPSLLFINKEFILIYRMSEEECARLREGVPYAKVCGYNPKHLCSNLVGCGDSVVFWLVRLTSCPCKKIAQFNVQAMNLINLHVII